MQDGIPHHCIMAIIDILYAVQPFCCNCLSFALNYQCLIIATFLIMCQA